tara:strand:+ start:2360 stop:2668 length:309 start_codon:yes stop_codon:yes gene_type:complete
MDLGLVEEDVKVPLPGFQSYVISASMASVFLSVILLLLMNDVFVFVTKWMWRAFAVGFLYLALLLAVAVKELWRKVEVIKSSLSDIADSGDMAAMRDYVNKI